MEEGVGVEWSPRAPCAVHAQSLGEPGESTVCRNKGRASPELRAHRFPSVNVVHKSCGEGPGKESLWPLLLQEACNEGSSQVAMRT